MGLRVELGAEDREGLVHYTLVAPVVRVREEGDPVLRQGIVLEGVAVVLGGDVAVLVEVIDDGLVLTAVAVRELGDLTPPLPGRSPLGGTGLRS